MLMLFCQFRNSFLTTEEDNYLGILPFFHIYGMVPVLMGSLQDGAFLTTVSKFDPETFLTAIQQQKVAIEWASMRENLSSGVAHIRAV